MAAVLTKIARVTGQVVLAGTVLVSPWFYGSIHPSTQQWLFWGVVIALVCGMATLFTDVKTRFQVSFLILPLLLFVFLVGLQLRVLPFETLQKVSPKTAELRDQLLPAPDSPELSFIRQFYPEAESNRSPSTPSVYPAATRHLLSLFVLACGFFVAAQILFKNRVSIFVFLGATVANGVLLSLFGIVVRTAKSNAPFLGDIIKDTSYSTFLNKNNAAGYLGMCLGASVVLLLWHLFRQGDNADSRSDRRSFPLPRSGMRYSPWLARGVLSLLLVSGIIVAGIILSFSRGGVIAMFGSILFGTLAVLAVRRLKWSFIGLIVVLFLGTGLMIGVQTDDRVQKNFESVIIGSNNARSKNWSDAWQTAKDFHWRGTGFGTYQYANLLNDEFAASNLVFVHAENQYVEIFCEMGITGTCVLALCVVLAVISCWFLLLAGEEWRVALGGGMFVALVSQLLASIFDFGLYTPSNAILLATLMGIATAVSGNVVNHNAVNRSPDSRTGKRAQVYGNTFGKQTVSAVMQHVAVAGIAVFFLTLLLWGQNEIKSVALIDAALERFDGIADVKKIDPEQLAGEIENLDCALQSRPDSALALQKSADARIDFYRILLDKELKAQPDAVQARNDSQWELTSLDNIHQKVAMYRDIGMITPLEAIQNHPAVGKMLVPAFCDLVRVRQACPLFHETYIDLAKIVPVIDKKRQQENFEQICIKRATLVAPYSAGVWYHSGLLENHLRHPEQARAYWRQCLTLSNLYLAPVIQITKESLTPENAATTIKETFPDSPKLYLNLLKGGFSKSKSPQFFPVILERFGEVVQNAPDLTNAEKHYYQGRFAFMKGDYAKAVEELKQACREQWNNPDYYDWLAAAYRENKQPKESQEAIEKAVFFGNSPSREPFRSHVKKQEPPETIPE